MASVDFTLADDAWTQITNGESGTLIQLKTFTSAVRIAVGASEPESDFTGFLLVPGNFEAIDIPLDGEDVFARSAKGSATIVALVDE